MGEKFIPKFIDPETGETKPIPPERLAEIEKEEKELEDKEREITIRLNPDATFADFCRAIKGAEEDTRDLLDADLWDHFDTDEVEGLLKLLEKPSEEYTDKEKELAKSKILDHFPKEDIEAFLPVKFEEDKENGTM